MVLVGIDEVGRGCWAGPLVAGAVALADDIKGLRDSKRLSRRQREQLSVIIQTSALTCGLGWVSAREVDSLGLTASVRLAYQRALSQLSIEPDKIIIDGSYNFLDYLPIARAIIRADDSIPAVSAASIIAKVARDAYMRDAASIYPGYGFEDHVGYGTATHYAALHTLGVCELHRRSYSPVRAVMNMGL